MEMTAIQATIKIPALLTHRYGMAVASRTELWAISARFGSISPSAAALVYLSAPLWATDPDLVGDWLGATLVTGSAHAAYPS